MFPGFIVTQLYLQVESIAFPNEFGCRVKAYMSFMFQVGNIGRAEDILFREVGEPDEPKCVNQRLCILAQRWTKVFFSVKS